MEGRFLIHSIHIYVVIIFGGIYTIVEPRYISNADETTKIYEPTPDCSSEHLTIDQLKAAAQIHCSGNEDRIFWEAACKCVGNQIPESECPKCRVLRNVESGLSNSKNRSNLLTNTTSPKSTTVEDSESMNKKLRLFSNSSSTASNSANFIRFGK